MNKLLLCLFTATCVLSGCGSSEESSVSTSKRRVSPLPSEAALAGSIPPGTLPTKSNFGGTDLTGLSFFSAMAMNPPFNVDEVYWARAASTEILSPALNGCEVTGTEIYFRNAGAEGNTPVAELHIWGWDADGACESFFEKASREGIRWRFVNLPGMYGETIRQADIAFKPL